MAGVRLWLPLCTAAGALVFAAVATAVSWSATTHAWWRDLALRGWRVVVIMAGLVMWLRASRRMGPLVVAAGASYYLGDLRVSEQPMVFAFGFCLAYVWVAVFGHVIVIWPSGRLGSLSLRALMALAYLAAIGTQVIRYVVDRPTPPWWYGISQQSTLWGKIGSFALVALIPVVVALTVRRWVGSTRLRRRPAAPVWSAFVLGTLLTAGPSLASALGAPASVEIALLMAATAVSLLGVVAALLIRRLLSEVSQLAVAKAVLGRTLETQNHPAQLQQVLADALGDPTLRLAYPAEDTSYIDIDGRPAEVKQDVTGRVITPVSRGGKLFGLIEHDEALNEQRKVADTAVTVAGLAIENAYLYATLRAEIEKIRDSRLRLSTAAFEERRRIQRDLHDTAQQTLFAVLVQLDAAEHALAAGGDHATAAARRQVKQAHARLDNAIKSVRELTQGIYPTVLVEHGLAAAVEGLADLSLVPVAFSIPDLRWPRHAEIVAYFVIAEAITNVRKHAQASRIDVAVKPRDTWIVVEIADDGRGGADLTGNGLRGLQDRVAAVGGSLTVDSPIKQGTRIIAAIPVEDQ